MSRNHNINLVNAFAGYSRISQAKSGTLDSMWSTSGPRPTSSDMSRNHNINMANAFASYSQISQAKSETVDSMWSTSGASSDMSRNHNINLANFDRTYMYACIHRLWPDLASQERDS